MIQSQRWTESGSPEKAEKTVTILKTAPSKLSLSRQLEAEVGFRQMWEQECLSHQSLGISSHTEIKCWHFRGAQVPSLHCHFPFSPLNTSGWSKHRASVIPQIFHFNSSMSVHEQAYLITLTSSCTYTDLHAMHLPIVFSLRRICYVRNHVNTNNRNFPFPERKIQMKNFQPAQRPWSYLTKGHVLSTWFSS